MQFIRIGIWIICLVAVANIAIYAISKLLHKANYKMTGSGYYLISLVVLMFLGIGAGWCIINSLH